MNVLALEPWYGGSHRRFLDGLARHSRHDVRSVTMAARYWKWRMQGGAVTLARKAAEVVAGGFRPDLLLAMGMTNLPATLALARRGLPDVPVVLYLHENQLTYPLREGAERDLTYAYVNYLSCLAADAVVFNSEFHRAEFLGALPALLARFPDYTHPDTVARIRERSHVVHLGLDLAALDAHRPPPASDGGPPVLLWNQRWEYDKNPEAFFRAVNRLDDAGLRFRLILAGQAFEDKPAGFGAAFARYADRVLHYGYAEDFAAYARLLHRADVIVSTSLHEFFGVAVMEAIYCGCHPVLPNRLTYPELVPERLHRPLLHAPVLYEDEDELFRVLRGLLSGREQPLPPEVLREIPERFAWPRHVGRFDALFEAVARA